MYNLVISYVSYETGKVSVEAKAGQVAFVNYAMGESKQTALQEVVITATAERSATVALMIERKKAAQVSDGISADLIRKTPDRTTSDVLKRVTGASIQEGKFAIIRGMNDRYNAGYLDGALLPSTESDRKAFAFDIVPASLLDNLQIIKSGSADLIGDFGGGIIKINTKSVPEKFTQNLSIGAQHNSITTGKDFLQFKKYGSETFNFLASERDAPAYAEGALKTSSSFATAAEKASFADITKGFNNNWSNEVISAPLNTRFAYSLGAPIRLSKTANIGVVFAVNYANTSRTSQGEVNTFAGTTSALEDVLYTQNISTGGLLNLNYVAGKTQISLRNLLNVNSDNSTVKREGVADFENDLLVNNFANIISYNRLYSGIVSLKQVIGDNKDMVFNAAVSYSSINRKLPEYRIANYSSVDGGLTYDLPFGDFFRTTSGRFFSNLDENLIGGNLDFSKQLNNADLKTELKVGYFYQKRDRTFSSQQYVYGGTIKGDPTLNPATDLDASKIGATGIYLTEKTSDGLAYYTGKSNLHAPFAQADFKYKELFRVVAGVRYESIGINIDNQKINKPIAALSQGDFLPSINVCFYLNEKTNLRADYFRSVNRPEFRELAPFAFYVFDKNAEIQGSPALQIATLDNYDIRYEFFPTAGQLLSVGAFYKTIQNPIEFGIDVAQPFTTFTYGNQKSATIYGLEFEVKKTLNFIGSQTFWNDIAVFANLSLIKSKLDFTNNAFSNPDRPLQGQSPFIVNAGIQYENSDNGWFGSVVVNRVGRRVAFVGTILATREDIYEAPRTVLDFQVGKNLGKFNLKLTVGDLLRNDQLYYQDRNKDEEYNASSTSSSTNDLLMFKYNYGFTTALTVGYTL